VRQHTSLLLSVQNLLTRNRGRSLSANAIKRLTYAEVDQLLPDAQLALAVKGSLAVMPTVAGVIALLEKAAKARARLRSAFKPLLTVSGIGDILGLTIMLETGAIARFAKVGNDASYGRCGGSQRISNGKQKGRGNTKNGNKYLAWAYIEAANFAVRYNPADQALLPARSSSRTCRLTSTMSPHLLSSRLLPKNRARSPIHRPLPTRFCCDHGGSSRHLSPGSGSYPPQRSPGR
jgi:transposase